VVEHLEWWRVDVCCVQETQWKGGNTRIVNVEDTFWNIVYDLVERLKKVDMVVFSGDLNGHVEQEIGMMECMEVLSLEQ